MKPHHLKSVLFMLAPCVALGGFALFLTRRAQVNAQIAAEAKAATQKKIALAAARKKLAAIPLQIKFVGAESQDITPIERFQNYDRHFSLIFNNSGGQPLWWGQPVVKHSAAPMRKWMFWLEHNGKRTPFKPIRTQLWSSSWDVNKKRYANEVFLQTGDVPAQAALKMKGSTQLNIVGGIYTGKVIPVEVTLKRAGEQWSTTPSSPNPSLAVKAIKILPPRNGHTQALVAISCAPVFESLPLTPSDVEFFNPQWKHLPKGSLPTNTITSELGPVSGKSGVVPLEWSSDVVKKSAARDIVLKFRVSQPASWALDVAFPIKKDGKPLMGAAPSLIPPMKTAFEIALSKAPRTVATAPPSNQKTKPPSTPLQPGKKL